MRTESSDKTHKFKELIGPEAAQGSGRAAEKPLTLLEEFSAILDKISLQLASSEDFAAWTKVDKIQQVKEIDRKPEIEAGRDEVKDAGNDIPLETQNSGHQDEQKEAQNSDQTEVVEPEQVQSEAEPEQIEAQEETVLEEELETSDEQHVAPEQIEQSSVESQVAATFQVAKTEQAATPPEKLKEAALAHAEEKPQAAEQANQEVLPQKFERLAVSEKQVSETEISKKVEQNVKPAAEQQTKVEVQTDNQFEIPNAIVAQQQVAANAQRKSETSELLESIMRSVLEVKMQELPVHAQSNQMTGKESLVASLLTRQLLGKSAMMLMDGTSNSIQSANQNVMSNHSFAARTVDAKESLRESIPQPLPKPLESRTMRQVEQVVKEAAKSKDGKTISMRLDPPELGSLKVDVSLRDSTLHARISAESAQVLGLLREKMAELQNMLRNLGLEVDSVSVSVQGDSQAFSSFEQEVNHNTANDSGDAGGENAGGELNTSGDFVPGTVLSQQNLEDHWVA